jgi:hypothetical protein
MTKAPISLQDLRRSLYVKAKEKRFGVSGDYTSTSARWRLCGKPTRWREVTAGHQGLTGSRSKPSRKAERKVFLNRFGRN